MQSNQPSILVNGIKLKNISLMLIPIIKNITYGKLCSVSTIKNIKKSKSISEETDNLFTPKFANSSIFLTKEKWKESFDFKL